jgi:prepilin-type processing-associated H-X9-DG protein
VGFESGGVNALMADGSVKFVRDSISSFQPFEPAFTGGVSVGAGGGLNKFGSKLINLPGSGTYRGGVSVAVGDLYGGEPIDGIYVSKISLPNLPFGAVDSRDAGVVGKARMLFNAEAARRAQNTNNLKQISIGIHKRFPAVEFFVLDGRSQESQDYLKVTMKEVLVTSWQTSTSGSAGDVAVVDSFSVNFARMDFD